MNDFMLSYNEPALNKLFFDLKGKIGFSKSEALTYTRKYMLSPFKSSKFCSAVSAVAMSLISIILYYVIDRTMKGESIPLFENVPSDVLHIFLIMMLCIIIFAVSMFILCICDYIKQRKYIKGIILTKLNNFISFVYSDDFEYTKDNLKELYGLVRDISSLRYVFENDDIFELFCERYITIYHNIEVMNICR